MSAHQLNKLVVWQKAIALAKEIYLISEALPTNEKFGLTSQMKRCAISIPSNIAEGAGRNNPKEFIHFLGIASGSCYELETQLILLSELQMKNSQDIMPTLQHLTEIQKMIYKLKSSLTSKGLESKL
ncbi:four helix bundle protein [Riemerella anatipestifer]|nr:four helix bundle protein [Riemerella anatipestifer]